MKFECLREDDQLYAALRNPFAEWKVAPILELFAGNFGINVDVLGSDSWPHVKHVFNDGSGVILGYQSVRLENMPLEDRFEIASRLAAKTPDEFLHTVGLPVSGQLVSLLDQRKRSALHWAAKRWIGTRYCSSSSPLASELEAFISALVKHGSSLHALDINGRTPLMHMLELALWDDDWKWPHVLPPHMTASLDTWGSLLVDGGVSLSAYVEQENMLLRLLETNGGIMLACSIHFRDTLLLHRIISCNQTSLQLEVIKNVKIGIWQYQPPPGSFNGCRHEQTKICWPPDKDDGDQVFWQLDRELILRSAPFTLATRCTEDLEPGTLSFDRLFEKPHDDHSAMEALFRRDRSLRKQHQQYKKPRSASAPPLGQELRTHYVESWNSNDMAWKCLGVHRCLLDSRWGFCRPWNESTWRGCMKGCYGKEDKDAFVSEHIEYLASIQRYKEDHKDIL